MMLDLMQRQLAFAPHALSTGNRDACRRQRRRAWLRTAAANPLPSCERPKSFAGFEVANVLADKNFFPDA